MNTPHHIVGTGIEGGIEALRERTLKGSEREGLVEREREC